MSARAGAKKPRVANPSGKRRRKKAWRDPNDWYVEPRWCVEALADLIGNRLGDTLVWDPCCGSGTIPDVFAQRGQRVLRSDLIDRGGGVAINVRDFLLTPALPFIEPCSIIFNPPYAKKAEPFIRHALAIATSYVAALVPLAFLASRIREPFYAEHPPLYVAIFARRPSMPPGALIAELGDRAFKGGKTDYCWIIWDRRQPNPMTRTIWLPACGQ